MVPDSELSAEDLAARIEALFRDDSRLRRMGRAARAFARTNAAERIVSSIEDLAHVPAEADET
jgi:UDP-N-acetylglucosamine:LPS N-acetylglucosamine transferase